MADKPKKRAPRVFKEPVVYTVGSDISQEMYDELVVKLADWFRQWRPDHPEPAADARHRIKCCLEGKTLEGKPWFTHWSSAFNTRVKMLCRFDPEKMQPIHTANTKSKAKKDRDRRLETARKQRNHAKNDPLIPPLTKAELKKNVNYGDSPHVLLTEGEQQTWQRYHDSYTEQFPELSTINAQAELSLLCDLHVLHERNRLKLLKGQQVDVAAMGENTKLITDLKKALGIHPDQLAKRVQEKTEGSLGDAVAKLADPKWRQLRERFWLEEQLVLYQMYVTPSPRLDGDGHQLDEIGLFAHAKCRTCHCVGCGTRNFHGIPVQEVEQYLIAKGVLEPIDEIPVIVLDDDMDDDEANADLVSEVTVADEGFTGVERELEGRDADA